MCMYASLVSVALCSPHIAICSSCEQLHPPAPKLPRAGAAALAFINSGAPADVMLMDVHMPRMSGVKVMQEVADMPPYPVVRTLSAHRH